MQNRNTELIDAARKKFSRFRELSAEYGVEQAWEAMLKGFPELQKQRMGPLLAKPTLIEGFRQAIPYFNAMGMEMEAVDISNNGMDAALEIQKQCPYLEVCREYGFEAPCTVICEMDIEASRRAFPEMKGEILSRQALGSSVCIFKYERPLRKDQDSRTHADPETAEDSTSP
ncbi:MAG: transcriptional regulator [Chlorobium sp.]|nr:MAG: transcriptional regulator [Chlorobium sp.]